MNIYSFMIYKIISIVMEISSMNYRAFWALNKKKSLKYFVVYAHI